MYTETSKRQQGYQFQNSQLKCSNKTTNIDGIGVAIANGQLDKSCTRLLCYEIPLSVRLFLSRRTERLSRRPALILNAFSISGAT